MKLTLEEDFHPVSECPKKLNYVYGDLHRNNAFFSKKSISG